MFFQFTLQRGATMSCSVSHAGAVPFVRPTVIPDRAQHPSSLPALAYGQVAVPQSAPPATAPVLLDRLETADSVAVVKQALDDLEAQGLLMLFDQHEQVAQRLTGDLLAAGVLQGTTTVEPVLATDTKLDFIHLLKP